MIMKCRDFISILSIFLFVFSFAACSDDDNDKLPGGGTAEQLIGSWNVIQDTGYDKTNGKVDEEWNDTYQPGEEVLSFGSDHKVYGWHYGESGDYTWQLQGNELGISWGKGMEADEDDFKILEMTPDRMVLEMHDIEEENGETYEWYSKTVLTRNSNEDPAGGDIEEGEEPAWPSGKGDKVTKIRVVAVFAGAEPDVETTYNFRYDEKGRISRYWSDRNQLRCEFKYDERGGLQVVRKYRGDTYTYQCRLNDKGYITEITEKNPSGTIYRYQYTYNNEGYLLECEQTWDNHKVKREWYKDDKEDNYVCEYTTNSSYGSDFTRLWVGEQALNQASINFNALIYHNVPPYSANYDDIGPFCIFGFFGKSSIYGLSRISKSDSKETASDISFNLEDGKVTHILSKEYSISYRPQDDYYIDYDL